MKYKVGLISYSVAMDVIDLGYWHSINIVTFLSIDRIGLLKCPTGHRVLIWVARYARILAVWYSENGVISYCYVASDCRRFTKRRLYYLTTLPVCFMCSRSVDILVPIDNFFSRNI